MPKARTKQLRYIDRRQQFQISWKNYRLAQSRRRSGNYMQQVDCLPNWRFAPSTENNSKHNQPLLREMGMPGTNSTLDEAGDPVEGGAGTLLHS